MIAKIKYFIELEGGFLSGLVEDINSSTYSLINNFNNKTPLSSITGIVNLFNVVNSSHPRFIFIIPDESSSDFSNTLLRLYEKEASSEQIKYIYLKIFDKLVKPDTVDISYHAILDVTLTSVNLGVSRFSTGKTYKHIFTIHCGDKLTVS